MLPVVEPVRELQEWLANMPANAQMNAPAGDGTRWLLSLAEGALPPAALPSPAHGLIFFPVVEQLEARRIARSGRRRAVFIKNGVFTELKAR